MRNGVNGWVTDKRMGNGVNGYVTDKRMGPVGV